MRGAPRTRCDQATWRQHQQEEPASRARGGGFSSLGQQARRQARREPRPRGDSRCYTNLLRQRVGIRLPRCKRSRAAPARPSTLSSLHIGPARTPWPPRSLPRCDPRCVGPVVSHMARSRVATRCAALRAEMHGRLPGRGPSGAATRAAASAFPRAPAHAPRPRGLRRDPRACDTHRKLNALLS